MIWNASCISAFFQFPIQNNQTYTMEFPYPFENIYQVKAINKPYADGTFSSIVLENGLIPILKPCNYFRANQNDVKADINAAFEK